MNKRLIKPILWMKAAEDDVGDTTGGGAEDSDTGGAAAGSSGDTGDTGGGWSETWREDYAGDDEAKLAKLSRYSSPSAAFDAMIAAQNKISSGEFKSTAPFPADGTEEEQNAWRESNGIPLTADKYELSLSDGLVIGENDQPIIDDFIEHAHSVNMSPSDVSNAVDWYMKNQEKIMEARQEADLEIKAATEDKLRADWGPEYRSNINRIKGLIATAPEEVGDMLMNARSQNGDPIMSNPDVMQFLVDLALEINPATTLVPNAGDNINGAIEDEIKALESMMGNKNSEYWKGPKADDNQARLRQLYAAREKMEKNNK